MHSERDSMHSLHHAVHMHAHAVATAELATTVPTIPIPTSQHYLRAKVTPPLPDFCPKVEIVPTERNSGS